MVLLLTAILLLFALLALAGPVLEDLVRRIWPATRHR